MCIDVSSWEPGIRHVLLGKCGGSLIATDAFPDQLLNWEGFELLLLSNKVNKHGWSIQKEPHIISSIYAEVTEEKSLTVRDDRLSQIASPEFIRASLCLGQFFRMLSIAGNIWILQLFLF